jgi:hypothetical protein
MTGNESKMAYQKYILPNTCKNNDPLLRLCTVRKTTFYDAKIRRITIGEECRELVGTSRIIKKVIVQFPWED